MNSEEVTNGQSPTIAQLYALLVEMKTEMGVMNARMGTLEEFAELRRYDTRPIWESLSAQIDRLRVGQEELRAGQVELRANQEKMFVEIAELRAGQNELRAGQETIKEELVRINHHMKRFDSKLQGAFGEIGDIRADFNFRLKEFEVRIEKLEPVVS